jgi:hypothetical protein
MGTIRPTEHSGIETRRALQDINVQLADLSVSLARWEVVTTRAYIASPASTSQLTMHKTGQMEVGLPVRFSIDKGSTYRYAVITAVSEDASITIAGASLSDDVDLLYVGRPEMVITELYHVAGQYGDGTADLLTADESRYARWGRSAASLVAFEATHATAAGTTQPKINVKVAGNAVSTNDSNAGLQLGAAGTWVKNSAVAISDSNYTVARGDALEIACTAAGNPTGGASDLTVLLTFVLA